MFYIYIFKLYNKKVNPWLGVAHFSGEKNESQADMCRICFFDSSPHIYRSIVLSIKSDLMLVIINIKYIL